MAKNIIVVYLLASGRFLGDSRPLSAGLAITLDLWLFLGFCLYSKKNLYVLCLVESSVDTFDLIYSKLYVVVGEQSLLCLKH
ncbi:hypothetical protein CLI80_03500 [Porphyromonas gingivalis]|nr:hypothetical protein CLI80_03500 [Porphyromonas gingivalis]